MQYSNDLRRKVIEAYQAGRGTQRELATLLGVSLGWIEKVLRHWRATGETTAKVFRHGPRSRLRPARVAPLVQRYPDATLAELGRRLHVTAPTVCRWLKRLGLVRKKRRSTPASAIRRASGGSGRGGPAHAARSSRGA